MPSKDPEQRRAASRRHYERHKLGLAGKTPVGPDPREGMLEPDDSELDARALEWLERGQFNENTYRSYR